MSAPTKTSTEKTPFEIDELEYSLPKSLIAQQPTSARDGARLLTLERSTGRLSDDRIIDLPNLLRPGDLLVLNDTKVLPAKFTARRKTGGKVPGLFVAEERHSEWCVALRGSRRLWVGEALTVGDAAAPLVMVLLEPLGDGQWRVRVESEETLDRILKRIGSTPLPPYIHRDSEEPLTNGADPQRYQTVYACRPGAIAAPTAGLHFTPALLDRIRVRGVQLAFVTLHVGIGTFKPIASPSLDQHIMHSEWFDLPAATAEAVRACRSRNGRVVAVGTTSARVLESAAIAADPRLVRARQGTTELFIYPPHRVSTIDALLTNFHLPRSTLLALVMAFAGIDTVRKAYAHAIEQAYRFYSYGDAMLIQ